MARFTPLLPHQILTSQIAEWLADSVNQAVTFHRTSQEAAAAIVSRGVNVLRSAIGSYGRGFYTATVADPFFGEAEIAVAIRLRRPLVGHADEVANSIDYVIALENASVKVVVP